MGRLGSTAHPLMLTVNTPEKAQEILAHCESRGWKAVVRIAPEVDEDLDDLDYKEDPPTLEYDEPKHGRNEPCHCGSGKKYKRCCLELDAKWNRFQALIGD
jgi:SWIM/SEC-C metal-binding protein